MKEEYEEKHKKKLRMQSSSHLRDQDAYENLIADYNEMLILFGYNVFFCSAAPLTPALTFGITFLKVKNLIKCRKKLTLSKCLTIKKLT
jgi:hypothetical protein